MKKRVPIGAIVASCKNLGESMKIMIRKAARKPRDRFVKRLIEGLERQENSIQALADANFRARVKLKLAQKQAITVLFVCHMPQLWSMFESIYYAMMEVLDFNAIVVALPYSHPTLPEGQYKDDGTFEYLKERGINVIRGYDKEREEWLEPTSIDPDYVFFQQPYPLLSPMWSVEKISMIARIGYVSYGPQLSKGGLERTTNPEGFFRYVRLFFMDCDFDRAALDMKFKDRNWFNKERVFVTGNPALDYLAKNGELCGRVWKRGMRKDVKRILWTPRWCTWEGTCHFFDYKDYFSEFCKTHQAVDFVFRPHPLCFQNFLKTGEMSVEELESMKASYENSANMVIDSIPCYEDTFLTSDFLISDHSSMLVEYIATGKPIIYTHRVDLFNEYGRSLSKGMYWVKTTKELDKTISMLLSGEDPLREKRAELINSLLFMPKDGSGRLITEYLRADYRK
jgi:hypothetical protein